MKKIVVLTGAGISAESGISTFRDANGLWEGHDIYEVASPEGFAKNPALVLDFYNKRRAQLYEVHPNKAHKRIASLETYFDLTVITQNVDDLHERAGSKKVIHLHGELRKVRSIRNENYILHWQDDLVIGDLDPNGHQLRPHIVWFGEAVPKMEEAVPIVANAEIILIVGTSMQVYPAAGLVGFAKPKTTIYYIDPKPKLNIELTQSQNVILIEEKATVGMEIFLQKLNRES